MIPEYIEHIGIAVKNLDEAISYYENVLGLKCYAIEEVKDQKVKTAFFKIGETKIELLESTDPDGPIGKFIKNKGEGIVIVDLKGVGEQISTVSKQNDQISSLHTLSRAELWLGHSVMGEWARELDLVTRYLSSEFKASKVNIDGTREAGLAALFLAATDGKINSVTLREAPVSYVFDSRENVDFFSMGIHLPGFLVWGDVSLVAALTGRNVTFIDPLTMSGGRLSEEDLRKYKDEYARIRQRTGLEGRTELK